MKLREQQLKRLEEQEREYYQLVKLIQDEIGDNF